jgi:hypothetical protein
MGIARGCRVAGALRRCTGHRAFGAFEEHELWLESVVRRNLSPGPVLGVGQKRVDRDAQRSAGCREVRESASLVVDVAGLTGPNDIVGVLSGETLIWHTATVLNGHDRFRRRP